MYECGVWDFPEILSAERFRGHWLERQEFFSHTLSRHRLILKGSMRGLESVKTPLDLYRTFSEGKGATLCGEKSPLYCSRLQQLAQLFPDAHFILIWRDPVEIYRSVAQARRLVPFFRGRRWLSNLVFQQEEMTRQAINLKRDGFRVHNVTYSDLVDQTEDICRGLCEFLGIEFDKKMLDLSAADLSALQVSPNHEHLRRGIIERRELLDEVVDPGIVRKLQRFQARWTRLRSECFDLKHESSPHTEPTLAERLYCKMTGKLFWAMHNMKRALFEFLPMPWLRTYRGLKNWFLDGQVAAPSTRPSIWQQFSENWATALVSYAILANVAALAYLAPAHVSVTPFYLIPCAVLTLVINGRWGTCAALITVGIWALTQALKLNFVLNGVLLWNCVMHFVLLEIAVLLLSRIRIETVSRSSNA